MKDRPGFTRIFSIVALDRDGIETYIRRNKMKIAARSKERLEPIVFLIGG